MSADLVVCDGAPDVTGLHDMDIYIQGQLLLGALHIAQHVLRPGGTFVAKMFRGKDVWLLTSQLEQLFNEVTVTKPPSSRNSSIESFVVCRNFSPAEGLDPRALTSFLNAWPVCDVLNLRLGADRRLVPFVACGDISGWDSDTTFPLDMEGKPKYVWKPPVQPPISPPYARANQHNLDSSMSQINLND